MLLTGIKNVSEEVKAWWRKQWMDRWKHSQIGRWWWTNGRVDVSLDEWMDGCMEGWMDRWMSRQTTWQSADGMDGWTDRQLPMATSGISILEDGWMDGWRPLPVSYLPLMDIVFLRHSVFIGPGVSGQSCSQSDTLTFLFDISPASQRKLPHERIDNSHLLVLLSLNEQRCSIY